MNARLSYFLVTLLASLALAVSLITSLVQAQAVPNAWRADFPLNDFSNSIVSFDEIADGGPRRDGIPPIDDPQFVSLEQAAARYTPQEPVISLLIGGEAKAYPLQILIWHEIVNDRIAGIPVAVTFCPLCNASLVFDARLEGRVLTFGTTGRLRNSDLIMYDRETESWWQQFTGEVLVGELLGSRLNRIPARIESFERFAARAPNGQVLVPNDERMRRYGQNPYAGYDSLTRPYNLYRGPLPTNIDPMARVVVVDAQAWSLALLRDLGRFEDAGLTFTWVAEQNSALDSRDITSGRDIGNVVVQQDGEDVVYDVAFAFAYHAFFPESEIKTHLQ